MEVVWISGEYSIRSRTSICSGIDKGVKQNIGDKDKVVNGVLPTNGWVDGMYESRSRTVLEVFYRTQAKRLAGVVGIS